MVGSFVELIFRFHVYFFLLQNPSSIPDPPKDETKFGDQPQEGNKAP